MGNGNTLLQYVALHRGRCVSKLGLHLHGRLLPPSPGTDSLHNRLAVELRIAMDLARYPKVAHTTPSRNGLRHAIKTDHIHCRFQVSHLHWAFGNAMSRIPSERDAANPA